eukprot:9473695-Pyramimonas_sp.AAC.2
MELLMLYLYVWGRLPHGYGFVCLRSFRCPCDIVNRAFEKPRWDIKPDGGALKEVGTVAET